jgi:hypothetical protein
MRLRRERAGPNPFDGPASGETHNGWPADQMPERSVIADGLYCPFDLNINKHAGAAETASLDWLARLNLMDTRGLARARRAHLTTLVAGFYPFVGHAELSLASDYVSWAFALDDIADETAAGARPAGLMELFERFDDVFDGATPGPHAIPLEIGLYEVLDRLTRLANRAQLGEFIEGNRAYFGAMLWEANNRAGNIVPDESSYNAFRPAAGAVPSFFALIEPLERIRLAQEVKARADVAELARLAGSIICWTNDLLSYDKERAEGDVHNLVIVYEHHRQLGPGAAASETARLINAATQDFLEHAATLPPLGAPHDTELRCYLRVLGSIMRITLHWTFESARYSGATRASACGAR